MTIGVEIVLGGIIAVLLLHWHGVTSRGLAAWSAELQAKADRLGADALLRERAELVIERERLTGWARRLVAREARMRPGGPRCATAAECVRHLSTINALTVILNDREHEEDLIEVATRPAPVDEAPADEAKAPAGAYSPTWVDSL